MKKLRFVNIGFGNMIASNRVVSIVTPESSPIKRLIQEAREHFNLIDATCGKRTKSVIILDSDHLVLSALQVETIASRLNKNESNGEPNG